MFILYTKVNCVLQRWWNKTNGVKCSYSNSSGDNRS